MMGSYGLLPPNEMHVPDGHQKNNREQRKRHAKIRNSPVFSQLPRSRLTATITYY